MMFTMSCVHQTWRILLEKRAWEPRLRTKPHHLIMVMVNVNHHLGDRIELKGKVAPDAERFAVSLGQTSLDLALYFNPRFESEGDAGIIVCNLMKGGVWEEEQREPCFPFQKGQDAKMSFCFDGQQLRVTMQEDQELTFPNRLGLETISFFSVEGDIKVTSFEFK
ncbi:galectin-1-like isoform X2 [Alligator sinensis]|uniref:Galectin n=1 Tax=Alligator sinensis TaxID=38654 RepID=A0A3Q0FS98_ALLSI|nr:galectin-1-like isoform X2 [Alligator sinensis]